MSKYLNILFVATILLIIILPTFVQAVDVNMNLTNDLDTNNVSNNVNQNLTNSNNSNNNTLTPNSNENISNNVDSSSIGNTPTTFQSGTVSTLSNLPEANLGLSNILSIILIVIGILLILLAIAILIRLKH